MRNAFSVQLVYGECNITHYIQLPRRWPAAVEVQFAPEIAIADLHYQTRHSFSFIAIELGQEDVLVIEQSHYL
jgi:hypothetical protein